jgi:hypothetical protein
MVDNQATQPVIEVRSEVRVGGNMLELVQQEHDMLANVIHLLEQLI